MDRVYINKDCCKAYTLLAIHTIYNTGNKEVSVNDFIKEIETMFKLYTDEIELMKKQNEILTTEGNNRIIITNSNEEKIGITIEECAKYMGVSKQLMSEIVREPGFPCLKFKRRILINKDKVKEWFDNNSGRRIKY